MRWTPAAKTGSCGLINDKEAGHTRRLQNGASRAPRGPHASPRNGERAAPRVACMKCVCVCPHGIPGRAMCDAACRTIPRPQDGVPPSGPHFVNGHSHLNGSTAIAIEPRPSPLPTGDRLSSACEELLLPEYLIRQRCSNKWVYLCCSLL
jgi:hypothetical protein